MIMTKSAGGVVINSKGEILVVNQDKTSWSLLKGHIENNESALKAAKREIHEETGIDQLELIRKLGDYQRSRLDDQSELKKITMFLFKTDMNAIKPIDSNNPEVRWVKKEEVAELLSHPKDKKFFLSIQDKI